MTNEQSFLKAAEAAWLEGDKLCQEFGDALLTAAGYTLASDLEVSDPVTHEKYRSYLKTTTDMPPALSALHKSVDALGKHLSECFGVVSRNVGMLAPYGGEFPRLVGSPLSPRTGIEPWSVLGWGNEDGFLEADRVVQYLHYLVIAGLDDSREPDWLARRLAQQGAHRRACQDWFSSILTALEKAHGAADVDPAPEAAKTALQQTIWKKLRYKALSQEDLADACDCSVSTLKRGGGLPELEVEGLVVYDRKIGGYYRPDAPPWKPKSVSSK